MADERVAEIDIKTSEMILEKARQALRDEIALVRDLLFITALPPGIKLTPGQKTSFDTALKSSLEVVALLAEKYNRAAIELKASHNP